MVPTILLIVCLSISLFVFVLFRINANNKLIKAMTSRVPEDRAVGERVAATLQNYDIPINEKTINAAVAAIKELSRIYKIPDGNFRDEDKLNSLQLPLIPGMSQPELDEVESYLLSIQLSNTQISKWSRPVHSVGDFIAACSHANGIAAGKI